MENSLQWLLRWKPFSFANYIGGNYCLRTGMSHPPLPILFPRQMWVVGHASLFSTESQNPYFTESKRYFFSRLILGNWDVSCSHCCQVAVVLWLSFTCMHINLYNRSQRLGRKVESTLVRNVASPVLLASRTALCGKQVIDNSKSKVF